MPGLFPCIRHSTLWGVDVSSKEGLFFGKYGKPSFEELGTALEALQPDVVVIAAPTNMHAQLVGAHWIVSKSRPFSVKVLATA